jgi:hypothetical protein
VIWRLALCGCLAALGCSAAGDDSPTLERAASGEFLEIRDGVIDGAALLFIAFTAPLEGRLDCGSKRFEAELVKGTSLAGDFGGQLTGALDPATQKLSGQWTLSLLSMASGHCDGPWSVTRQQ